MAANFIKELVPHGLKDRASAILDESSKAVEKGQEINDAKKVLPTEATAMVHGREAADAAAETARRTFEQGETSLALPSTFTHTNTELTNSTANRTSAGTGRRRL